MHDVGGRGDGAGGEGGGGHYAWQVMHGEGEKRGGGAGATLCMAGDAWYGGEEGWGGVGGGFAWQVCAGVKHGEVVLLCRSQGLQAVKIGTAMLVAGLAVALAVYFGGAGVSQKTSSKLRGFPASIGPLLKSGQVT